MFPPLETKKKIVILGCGFAGLELVKELKKILKDSVEITVVDKSGYFTYNPGLFDFFSGKIKEKDVVLKYEELFKGLNIEFIQDKVINVKTRMKTVNLENSVLKYDFLVVALGSQVKYNHLPRVDNKLFLFDSFNSVKKLSTHINSLMESLKNVKKIETQNKKLTFVVVGGGLTGIELVFDLREKLYKLCRKNGIKKKNLDITLIQEGKILEQLEERVGIKVHDYLEKLNIHVIVGQRVTRVDEHRIYIGDGRAFATDTIIWCGGVMPTKAIFRSDLTTKVDGGIIVNNYLQSVTNPNVYALGDNVHFEHENKKLSKTYLHAIDKAKYVALNLVNEITGDGEKHGFIPKEDKFWFKLGSWNGIYFKNDFYFDGFFISLGKSLKDKYRMIKFRDEFKKLKKNLR